MIEQAIPEYLERLLNSSRYNNHFRCYVKSNFKTLFDSVDLRNENKIKFKLDDIDRDFNKQSKFDISIKPFKKIETVPYKKESYVDSSLGFIEETYDDTKIKKTKTIIHMVEKDTDIIPALKCILWSLNNKPKTIKDLLTYLIKKDKNGTYLPYLEWIEKEYGKDNYNRYDEVNNALNKAVCESQLYLDKIKGRTNKQVWLYSNPTNKRQGYYYRGKLWKLKELSNINGVKEGTIQRRFQTLSIEQSIK